MDLVPGGHRRKPAAAPVVPKAPVPAKVEEVVLPPVIPEHFDDEEQTLVKGAPPAAWADQIEDELYVERDAPPVDPRAAIPEPKAAPVIVAPVVIPAAKKAMVVEVDEREAEPAPEPVAKPAVVEKKVAGFKKGGQVVKKAKDRVAAGGMKKKAAAGGEGKRQKARVLG